MTDALLAVLVLGVVVAILLVESLSSGDRRAGVYRLAAKNLV
jgi:hypothetical protein